ncbi:hypothetical protein HYN48_12120 [Flavobacterium magnum]|uniref:Uncharacterized protein n=1 Tax=Flavobacterium magnum TaxID=2162713 RepID=A0A2S0RG69_9FLAO|nr:hypothetical protein [Flavobacterium magnum]AWA30763.1 hypothetical protein HYN48_12120 [Flavobacterium magnum]
MKKSITTLVVALFATFNAAHAANLSNTDNRITTSADPSLITSELGTLKKYNRTIDDIIAADLKITEASLPSKKPVLKKKAAKRQIKIRKQFSN